MNEPPTKDERTSEEEKTTKFDLFFNSNNQRINKELDEIVERIDN